MTIVDIQRYPYRLPFASSFVTAHGVMTTREGAIVEIITDRGISGIGEIAPLPEFRRGSLADACSLLPKVAACLRGKTLDEALTFVRGLVETPSISGHPHESSCPSVTSMICGLEIALLDALGKTRGCSIATLLSRAESVPRTDIRVNALIGGRETEAAVAAAREAKNNGFGCVKLKVGCADSIQGEIERVAAVREAIGPDMHLRLDANEAWTLDEARVILSQCRQYDIQYVEQPLKAHDLSGMRVLRHIVPIAADEAVYDLASGRRILDSEAADVLIVKPQCAGGLTIGQQMIEEAAERGVCSVVTSTIDGGIGLVAALHLAVVSSTITLECGLATQHLLVDDLLVDDLPIRNGWLRLPNGSGLGVALDREALERYI